MAALSLASCGLLSENAKISKMASAKFASILTIMALAELYVVVQAILVCDLEPIELPDRKLCPQGTLNDSLNMCCHDEPDVPGTGGKIYCEIPILLPGGTPQCPPSHTYNTTAQMCCGIQPISDADQELAKEQAERESKGNTGGNNGGSNGGSGSNAPPCVDKAAPGRASDCPANANLCNDSTYYSLMTDQCPKTCNRCPTGTQQNNPATGGSGSGGCVDGTNARTGSSDCPANKARCDQDIWRDFMRKECPFTCGVCGGSGSTSGTTSGSTATTRASSSTAGGSRRRRFQRNGRPRFSRRRSARRG